MTETLVTCASCSRHVRASEATCPFCLVAREPSTHTRTSLAALAFGAALAGAVPADAQPAPRLTMEHAPAQGYGAPPFHPFGGGGGDGYGTVGPLGPQHPAARSIATRVVVTAGRDRALASAVSAVLRNDTARWGRCRALDRRPVAQGEVERESVTIGASPTPGRPAIQRSVVGQCLHRELMTALSPARTRRMARRGEVVVEFHFRAVGPGAHGER
jgi:hypothetical protein